MVFLRFLCGVWCFSNETGASFASLGVESLQGTWLETHATSFLARPKMGVFLRVLCRVFKRFFGVFV